MVNKTVELFKHSNDYGWIRIEERKPEIVRIIPSQMD
jgi:hypothetical protein